MIKKIPDSEYFASEGLSNSFLQKFDRSPAHGFIPTGPTDAMKKGTLIHKFLLDLEAFDNDYLIADIEISNRVCKAYKDIKKETTKEIILYKTFEELVAIKNAMQKAEFEGESIGKIIENSELEMAIYWGENIKCKGKVDILNRDMKIIFDIKKCDNALTFQKSINNYEYYRQAAWYLEGIQEITGENYKFIFIPIEDKFPHGIKCYELDIEYLRAGMRENWISVQRHKAWDGDKTTVYSNDTVKLFKPDWL